MTDYPLIYITEPVRGKAILNIAPGDHTVQRYDLSNEVVLRLTHSLLDFTRRIVGENRGDGV